MSVTDFLFNGSPPPSVTTYGSATQNLPQWYSDYTQGLLAKANAVAAEPYQAYGGPRLADFTADQQASFDKTRGDIGAHSGTLGAGVDALNGAVAANPLDAAQPWLQNASQSSVANVNSYMNPYTDAVVDRIGDLGARNLNEKLMPAIGDQFTKAGQYGSTRMQESTGRALRDTQESVLAEQNKALSAGYTGALSASQADLARQGQLGQVAGNLASADQTASINAGARMGELAQAGQTMDLKDTAALSAVGGQQQALDQKNLDTAYGDFTEQRSYPASQISFMNNVVRGMQVPTSTSSTQTAPSSTYTASPLATLASGLGGIQALFKAKGGMVKKTDKRRPVKGGLAQMKGC